MKKELNMELYNKIALKKVKSKWEQGVKMYALDLIEEADENGIDLLTMKTSDLEVTVLNGAKDWYDYSFGGCSLIYDEDIAKRLCTPLQLEKTRNGKREPNKFETWLDVQARALYQAYLMIKDC